MRLREDLRYQLFSLGCDRLDLLLVPLLGGFGDKGALMTRLRVRHRTLAR